MKRGLKIVASFLAGVMIGSSFMLLPNQAQEVRAAFADGFLSVEDVGGSQKFYNKLVSAADTNGDGKLTQAECAQCTRIVSTGFSCNSAWIPYFTGLQTLTLSGAGISSADLSKLTNLTSLNLSDCNLTSLNLSSNTKLTSVTLSGNPNLSSVTLPSSSGITSFKANNCALTSLDCSSMPSLTILSVRYNKLTSLNVTKCTGLIELYCEGNKLSSLNINNCKNLDTVYCYDNPMTTLSVAGLTYLEKAAGNISSYADFDGYSSGGYVLYVPTGCTVTKSSTGTTPATPTLIPNSAVTGVNASYTYTGSAIKPSVTVVVGGKTLVSGTDYTLSYGTNTAAGTNGYVTVAGKGNYTGTVTKTFSIVNATPSTVSIAGGTVNGYNASYTYTGSAIKPSVSVVVNGKTLASGTDYTVSYGANTNVGNGQIIITGKGNYTGTLTKTFSITAMSVAGATVSGYNASYTYTGSAIKPSVSSVKLNNTALVVGIDYTVSYASNTNVGNGQIIITGKGNYGGTLTKTFPITAKSLSGATINGVSTSYPYTGSAIKPTVSSVVLDGKTLVNGTDYTISYGVNTSIGTSGTITITGKGNYTGTASKTFSITAQSISGATINGIGASYTYTGSAITPSVSSVVLGGKTLVNGTDYTVSYKNNTGVGTATVTITGKGIYSGTASKTFSITAKSLSGATINGIVASYTYTGSAINPSVSSVVLGGKTLVNGTDYTVSYGANTNVGTGTVIITGKGNYTGTVSKSFNIVKPAATTTSISGATIGNLNASYTYTGSAIAPTVTVTLNGKTLAMGTDYFVTYSGNTNVSSNGAKVTITGNGNYSGTISKTFSITAKSISGATVSGVNSSYVYTGSAFKPSVTVVLSGKTLTSGTDYTVTYSTNTAIGSTGTVTITGKGNYSGTIKKSFTITAKSLDGSTVSGISSSYTYTGSAIKPSVSVAIGGKTLVNGTDYTVTYGSNTNVGTGVGKVTITGKGTYGGTINKTFTITAKSISGATVNGVNASYTYTGSAIKPTVSSVVLSGKTLVNGTDYTVSYGANTSAGTGTVTITGKGNYSGTVTKSFTITKPTAKETGVEGFCERLYTCALNRASDKNGKANWVQQINYGMSGGDVAKQFFLSKELKNSGISNEEYVRRLYLTFFDREPDAAGKANWLNALNSKTLTREQVLQQFIDSTEWANLCLTFGIESGGKGVPTITVAPSDRVIAFATRLYTTCLGRQPDKTGLTTWSNNLANRKVTGQQAAITFFSSAEFKNHNYPNDEFIKRCYRTFLNREPDTTGYNAYLAALNNKSLTRDQMVKDFSTSTEFKRLCSSSGIKPY